MASTSSDRLKHWMPAVPPGALSTVSIRNQSLTLPTIPVLDADAPSIQAPSTTLLALDLNKADVTFPPVRQPSYPLRRYTRRIPVGPRRPVFLYEVSRPVYVLLWLVVLLLHLICALFLGGFGASQFYLLGTTLIGYITLYGITVDPFYLPPIGVGCFVACGLHAFSVVTILFYSLRSQRSVFTSTPVLSRTVTTPVMRLRRMSITALSSLEFRTQSVLERLPSPFVRACYRTWHTLIKLYKATDIRNECYYSVYVVRLILQSLLHSHQLYLSSIFLPQPRVNFAWVILFVVNCWAPPLLSWVVRSNRPRTRLLCVFINLSLDIGGLIVIPSLVTYPYAVVFDGAKSNFPRSLWYTDVWFMRTVLEFRMLAVVTPLDFVTKIGVALNIWRSLRVIPIVLRKKETNVDVAPAQASEPDPTGSGSATRVQQPPVLSHADSLVSQVSSQNLVIVETSGRCSTGVLGSLVVMLLGGAVLAAHLQANAWPPMPHCRLPIQAWFASKPACSFIEYRCVNPNQLGNEQELAAVISGFDPSHVTCLSIRNCPQVEFPLKTRELNNLLGLKLYKSTLAHWEESTAVTSRHHPTLRFVFLIDVQMTEFPRGLMATDFPQKLMNIEIYRTNLSSLPDQLDRHWPTAMTLAFEEIPFTQFPSVVARLRPSALSLAKSHLTSVPTALFNHKELNYIILNGNPLRELPGDIQPGPKFTSLAICETSVSSVPEAFANVHVDAMGSPLCGISGHVSSNVDCATPVDPDDWTMYPFTLEEQLNGLN